MVSSSRAYTYNNQVKKLSFNFKHEVGLAVITKNDMVSLIVLQLTLKRSNSILKIQKVIL